MIDWTDRSEDVLARFEAWKRFVIVSIGIDITDELKAITESEHILMQDLATHVDRLTMLAMLLQHAPDHTCSPELYRITLIATWRNPETGERLFPEPKE